MHIQINPVFSEDIMSVRQSRKEHVGNSLGVHTCAPLYLCFFFWRIVRSTIRENIISVFPRVVVDVRVLEPFVLAISEVERSPNELGSLI